MLKTKEIEPVSQMSIKMKWSLLNRVDDFANKNKYQSRTQCIHELLDLALRIHDKVKNTPEFQLKKDLEEAKEQLQNHGLVDYLMRMSPQDLATLKKLVSDEFMLRNRNGGNGK